MAYELVEELYHLEKTANSMNVALNEDRLNKFKIYTETLLRWNAVMNLTTITDPMEIMEKHYLDSISPLFYNLIPQNCSLIDIGSGAGFPGLPLKIARPDIKLTLLDSMQKRINFIIDCLDKLLIADVQVVCGRAEETAQNPQYREQYDVVVSRAVADLRALCEYCIPFVKVGGLFLAYKGENSDDEIKEANNAISALGGTLEKIYDVKLPNTDKNHIIIAIRKTSSTEMQYPRKQAKISKTPL